MDLFKFIVHLFSSIIWIGGMIYTIIILMKAVTTIEPPERGKLIAAGKRFLIMSWICVILILVSGFAMTPHESIFDFSTNETMVLNIKILLFFVMIINGLIMTFVLLPKMIKSAPKPGEPPSHDFIKRQKLLPKIGGINLVLGVLVIVCVAILFSLTQV